MRTHDSASTHRPTDVRLPEVSSPADAGAPVRRDSGSAVVRDPFEDPSGEDPANWDCCDEHETVFRKGAACDKCLEEEAQQDAKV